MKKLIEGIGISGIRSFSAQYADREDMVFLTIGEPDFDTPSEIKAAAIEALKRNDTHYPPALGKHELRDAIAKQESKFGTISYGTENVIIVSGATEALVLAFWSILLPGDEVIVPIPSFPLYQTQIHLGGARAVLMDTSENEFQISYEMLMNKLTKKTRAIVLTSPNNPTGTILNQKSIDEIYRFVKENPDVYVVMDEVYRSMIFVEQYPSLRYFQDIKDQIIVVQSFSKSHAMTGWRVGYVLAQEEIIDRMHRLHQNMVTGVNTLAQNAALKALDVKMDKMMLEFKKRRDYVCSRLDQMGIEYVKPEGALYIFFSVKEFGLTSLEFGNQLAQKQACVLVPGSFFGTDGFMRLSFGASLATLEKGLDRLEKYIHQIRNEKY